MVAVSEEVVALAAVVGLVAVALERRPRSRAVSTVRRHVGDTSFSLQQRPFCDDDLATAPAAGGGPTFAGMSGAAGGKDEKSDEKKDEQPQVQPFSLLHFMLASMCCPPLPMV